VASIIRQALPLLFRPAGISPKRLPSSACHRASSLATWAQGLTLVHVRAQLEQLQDTVMMCVGLYGGQKSSSWADMGTSVRPYLGVVVDVAPRGEEAARQGLTLVHFLAQRKHFLWDTLGTFSRWMGHDSSETGHKQTP
jgi:hypothetical protein